MKQLEVQVWNGPNRQGDGAVVRTRLALEDDELETSPGPMLFEQLPHGGVWLEVREACRAALAAQTAPDWSSLAGAIAARLEEDRWPTEPRRYWTRPVEEMRSFDVYVEAHDPDVIRLALAFVIRLLTLLASDPVDAGKEDRLNELLRHFRFRRSKIRFNWITTLLAEAARERGVPVLKLLPGRPYALIGQGRHRRRLQEAWGDGVSVFGNMVSRDKQQTAELLRRALVPVPRQIRAQSDDEIRAAVEAIGPPVVVKGQNSDTGISVTTNITTPEELQRAVEKVRKLGDQILVERHIPGDDYRLTLVEGELIAAVRRIPPQVVGDGTHSIAELIELENGRRRGMGRFSNWVVPLSLNAEARALLATVGLTQDSIPVQDQVVRLSGAANLSRGGLAVDVTDEVHPNVVATVERAARCVGVSLAGVDLITTDITRPLNETGGAIIEINVKPGLRPHYVTPTPPRDVAGAMIERWFPAPEQGRIPTVGVTGTNGKTTVCRLISGVLGQNGAVVGTTSTAGIHVNGQLVTKGDLSGGGVAQSLLADPGVDAAVFELARGAILRSGLTLEDLDVGVVTNVSEDHLGQDGIDSLEELARVKRLVVEIARRAAVLNADDANCRAMAAHVKAPIWWVSRQPRSAVIESHLAGGGQAVLLEASAGGGTIIHQDGSRRTVIADLKDIPSTWGGRAVANVENALSATAACLGLGIPIEQLRSGLAQFENTPESSPGRLNMREVDGVRLIYDFVHNEAGMRCLGETLAAIPVAGRRLAMLSHTDKRSDEFYAGYTRLAADLFDAFVVTEDPTNRLRPTGAVTRLLTEGLRAAGVEPAAMRTAPTIDAAVAQLFGAARPGDLLLLTGGFKQPMWEYLDRFQLEGASD